MLALGHDQDQQRAPVNLKVGDAPHRFAGGFIWRLRPETSNQSSFDLEPAPTSS